MEDPLDALCALLREAQPAAPCGVATEAVLACARAHRVHLLLATRVQSPGLAADLRAAAAFQAARDHELRRVLDTLHAAGVPAIVIKGAALGRTHYARPELRPSADVDVLIRAEHRPLAARALESNGYRRPAESDGSLSVSQFHLHRTDRAGIGHALDVHWRISNVQAFADALSYAEIARDGVPLPGLGEHALGPSAVHSLLIACVHRVSHHRNSPNLLWLHDVHVLARALTPQESVALTKLARERRLRAVCLRSLELAVQAFGRLPHDLIASLEPEHSANAGDKSAADEPTAAFLDRDLRQVDILVADLAALPSWPARAQLLREHLFPDRAFMYARYGTRQPLSLPWLYVRRMVAGAPKWFRRGT